MKKAFVAFAMCTASLPLSQPADAAQAGPAYKEGEVIVRFQTHLATGDMARIAAAGHRTAQIARTMATAGRPHTVLVRFPRFIPVEAMVAHYRNMPGVVDAQPNYVGHVNLPRGGPSSRAAPSLPRVIAGHRIDLAAAAAASSASALPAWFPNDPDFWRNPMFWNTYEVVWPDKAPGPLVAMIGSGIDPANPDLAGHVIMGNDWVNGDKNPDDDYGMGTHEAGIVAAGINNGKGLTGISNGKVLAIKVMDSQGWWTVFDLAGGLLDAAMNPLVKVVYVDPWEQFDDPTIRNAVQTAVNNGELIVANTGYNTTGPLYPAFYSDPSFPTLSPSVISVAGTGLTDYQGTCPGPNCFSNTNYNCLAPFANPTGTDTFWPGVGIYSTTPTHPFWFNTQFGVPFGYAYFDGSADAAAGVAGAAARILASMPSGTTAAQLKNKIVATGDASVPTSKTTMIDTNGDGVPDTPCMPAAMSDTAIFVAIAPAMGRHGIYGHVYEAATANVLAKSPTVSAVHNGKPAGVGGKPDASGQLVVINLPNDNVTPYQVQINAPGYTAGPVTVDSVLADDCGGNFSIQCTYQGTLGIGLPPNIPGRYHIVTNWQWGSLETDLFTPTAGPIQCEVGIAQISSLFCFLGSLTSAPFARLLHHGATDPSIPWEFGDDLVSLKGPLYPTSPGIPYEIFLNTLGTFNLPYQQAVTRIWTGGKIVGRFDASRGDSTTNNCTYSGGATPCDLLYVGDLSQAGAFTPKGIYGTSSAAGPPGVVPYTAIRVMSNPPRH